jgi:hypothetical protein
MIQYDTYTQVMYSMSLQRLLTPRHALRRIAAACSQALGQAQQRGIRRRLCSTRPLAYRAAPSRPASQHSLRFGRAKWGQHLTSFGHSLAESKFCPLCVAFCLAALC